MHPPFQSPCTNNVHETELVQNTILNMSIQTTIEHWQISSQIVYRNMYASIQEPL